MNRNEIISTIIYTVLAIPLYYLVSNLNKFYINIINGVVNDSFMIYYFIIFISFWILFILSSKLSKNVENRFIFLIPFSIYLIVSLLLFQDKINYFLLFAVYFILKTFGYEYKAISQLLYLLVIFAITYYNSFYVESIKSSIMNLSEKFLNTSIDYYTNQSINTFIAGYDTAEYILYQSNKYECANILVQVRQPLIENLTSQANNIKLEYQKNYTNLINDKLSEIFDKYYMIISLTISLTVWGLFITFLNIEK
ncbi:MAG: hypothetical protein ACPLX8_01180 [Nanopusillaceae archaeon]